MREIKFRAWDKKHNKWIGKNDFITLAMVYTKGDIWYLCANGIIKLMQYTGLKDKNGKEIYEGDIVNCLIKSAGRWKVDFTSPIKWSDDGLNWNIWPPHSDYLAWEVIGNIYENKELLK